MRTDKENFFILLELDPNVRDKATIESAIKAFKGKASKMSKVPDKEANALAKQYLKWIKEKTIQDVMLDSQKVAEEAKNAIKILKKAEEAHKKALSEKLYYLAKGNQIDEQTIQKILTRDFEGVSLQQFKKWFPKVKVVANTTADTEDIPKNPYEGVTLIPNYKQIKQSLNIVNKSTLYDFLGDNLSAKSNINDLIKIADAKYVEYNKMANKADPKVSAGQSLASTCKTYFKTEEKIREYEATRANEKFESLVKLIDDFTVTDKFLDQESQDKLFKFGGKEGLSIDEVKFKMHEYCKKKGIQIIKQANNTPKYKSCNFCHTLLNINDKSCSECGNPTETTCPKCNSAQDTKNKNCTSCGFAIGSMPLAKSKIAEAKTFINKDWQKVKLLAEQALNYHPNHKEALDLISKADQKEQESRRAISTITNLINQKKYYAARQQLLTSGGGIAGAATFKKEIDTKIQEVERLVQQARTERNNDRKIEILERAAIICADSQAVADELPPPSAPTGMQVTDLNDGFKITWQKPKRSTGIEYTLVRSEGKIPNNPSDGKVLRTGQSTEYVDYELLAGKTYYYAVYSQRGKTPSVTATKSAGKLFIQEVEDISIKAIEGQVNVSWKAIDNCHSIAVTRSDAHGKSRRKINDATKQGFSDKQLSNGQKYHYNIVVNYLDVNKKTVKTKGIQIEATPTELPKPVQQFSARIDNKIIFLQWQQPTASAQTIIYQSTKKPELPAGSILSLSEATQYGNQVLLQQADKSQLSLNFQGKNYFIPFSVQGQTAVLGKVLSLTSIDEVKALKGGKGGGSITLQWQWPRGINQVKIYWSFDGYAKESTNCVLLKKEEYDIEKSYDFDNPLDKTYYFTVCSVSQNGTQEIMSTGAQVAVQAGRAKRIKYDIKKNIWGKKKIEIFTEDQIQLPSMVLLAKRGTLPKNSSDGEAILKTTNSDSLVSESIPSKYTNKNYYIKLFLENQKEVNLYRIMSPARDKLKI